MADARAIRIHTAQFLYSQVRNERIHEFKSALAKTKWGKLRGAVNFTTAVTTAHHKSSSLGYQPIRVETGKGREEYEHAQRLLCERAAPLRQRLIDQLGHVLAAC